MNALVIKPYTDKNDGSVHMAGNVVDLADDRFKELCALGFVEEAERETQPDESTPYSGMKLNDLRAIAKERGVNTKNMTKKQLEDALLDLDGATAEDPE